jgi:4-amino-4-deoxy-L-arabinose transferase-like glycosyltransferase
MGPYYLALWFWVRIGNSDTWIRLLSALATVAAIWGIWVAVRRWSGNRIAAVAVAVFAFSPFVLSWSMQARGYSMAMAFTAWALVFADILVRGDDRRSGLASAAAVGVMVGLAVASHLAAAGVFVGMIITMVVLAPGRRMVRNLAVAGVSAGVCFAPFAIAVAQDPSQDWIPDLDPQVFLKQLVEAGGGSFAAFLIVVGLVCAILAVVRDVRFRPYLLAIAGIATGVICLVIVSIFLRPMFISRYLAPCVPLAVVAAVGGWSWLMPRRWTNRTVSIAAIAVVGAFAVNLGFSLDQTRPVAQDVRGVAAFLEAAAEPGDAIVAVPSYFANRVRRYLPAEVPTHRLSTSTSSSDSLVIVDRNGREFAADRIWVVLQQRQRQAADSSQDRIAEEFPVVTARHSFGVLRLELREKPSSG